MSSKSMCKDMLAAAGIQINGSRPWDIVVNNENFYKRVLIYGSLGLGESYMDGWWDCKKLDDFFYKVLDIGLQRKLGNKAFFVYLLQKISNLKNSNPFTIGKKHYDIGNDLFKNMLDRRMVYSCAYWKDAKNLDEAQEAKLELACRKLGLKPGMKVLDIGCGWGSFLKYATEKYKVRAVGLTVSKEQLKFARGLCKNLDIEIRLQDYRDLNEKFDRIVSIGMFEHVGYKNYKTYMKVVHKSLNEDGLFLLQTIGKNNSWNYSDPDPWIVKYIFPGGMLPSIRRIGESVEGLFVTEDLHNFGADYDKTLLAWYNNFNKNWNKIKSNYNERFYRMWTYSLLSFAGAFRARRIQLWQVVLSKNGAKGGYKSIR